MVSLNRVCSNKSFSVKNPNLNELSFSIVSKLANSLVHHYDEQQGLNTVTIIL